MVFSRNDHASAAAADRPTSGTPQSVAVIGAGIVGLATAWFLQESGVQVTVYEQDRVGSGASGGNAGWLAPSLTRPFPSASARRGGALQRMLRPGRQRAPRGGRRATDAFVPLNDRALEAFDVLTAGGVAAPTHRARTFLACFRRERELDGLLEELEHLRDAGQESQFHPVTGWRVRAMEPALTDGVGAAIQVYGQRYLHPPDYLRSLAAAVRERGSEICEGVPVTDLRDERGGVTVVADTGEYRHDAALVASGARLGELAGRFGVSTPVHPRGGLSFSVPVTRMPTGPLFFPRQQVTCTPLGGRLRVTGPVTVPPSVEPGDRRITVALRPFLRGVGWEDRREEWSGSQPCTPDGLPLLGGTASPRVFVAGGHGGWGLSLGPVSGMLVAQAVLKGEAPRELAPFDPLR